MKNSTNFEKIKTEIDLKLLDTDKFEKVLFSFKPDGKLISMLQVLSFIYKKTPSKIIEEKFSEYLAEFTCFTSKEGIPINQSLERTKYHPKSALGILEEKGVIKLSFDLELEKCQEFLKNKKIEK